MYLAAEYYKTSMTTGSRAKARRGGKAAIAAPPAAVFPLPDKTKDRQLGTAPEPLVEVNKSQLNSDRALSNRRRDRYSDRMSERR